VKVGRHSLIRVPPFFFEQSPLPTGFRHFCLRHGPACLAAAGCIRKTQTRHPHSKVKIMTVVDKRVHKLAAGLVNSGVTPEQFLAQVDKLMPWMSRFPTSESRKVVGLETIQPERNIDLPLWNVHDTLGLENEQRRPSGNANLSVRKFSSWNRIVLLQI